MILSRTKNQKAAKDAVQKYLQQFHNGDESKQQEYERFVKFFAKEMTPRIAAGDCYFIDLFEDLERLGDE